MAAATLSSSVSIFYSSFLIQFFFLRSVYELDFDFYAIWIFGLLLEEFRYRLFVFYLEFLNCLIIVALIFSVFSSVCLPFSRQLSLSLAFPFKGRGPVWISLALFCLKFFWFLSFSFVVFVRFGVFFALTINFKFWYFNLQPDSFLICTFIPLLLLSLFRWPFGFFLIFKFFMLFFSPI
jgi:hypothetical protein